MYMILSYKQKKYAIGIIVVLSFLLYGNTLFNKYALDDSISITKNRFTKMGMTGIKDIMTHSSWEGWHGLNHAISKKEPYSPLSIVTFAIEHHFFRGNPHISHAINVFLFAITCVLFFLLLQLIFKETNNKQFMNKWYYTLPFIATILFLVHPIHTEIVANIKGRDEILAFIFSLLTLLVTIRYLKTRKWYYLVFNTLLFSLALLSKESSMVFILLIPLTTWFFIEKSLKKNTTASLPILFVGIAFCVLRFKILVIDNTYIESDLLNNPFLNATFSQRYSTIMYTLGLYIKLLLFPHPLTTDYYPYHISLMKWFDFRVIISIIAYAFIIKALISGFIKKSVISYSIIVFIIPILIFSNIIFSVGTFMSERFLYVPSFGFSILIAWLLIDSIPKFATKNNQNYIKTYEKLLPIILILITGLLSAKTIHRNMQWKDDFTLYSNDVKVSKNSIHSNVTFGNMMLLKSRLEKKANLKKEYFNTAITHLRRVIEIQPVHEEALKTLGMAYEEAGKIDSTAYYLELFSKTNPNKFQNYMHLGFLYGSKLKDIDKSLYCFNKSIAINANDIKLYIVLASILKENARITDAIKYLEIANSINPLHLQVIKDLAYLYDFNKDYVKYEEMFARAYDKNPEDLALRKNLITIYNNILTKQ